mgnify:CR=1 FL=1
MKKSGIILLLVITLVSFGMYSLLFKDRVNRMQEISPESLPRTANDASEKPNEDAAGSIRNENHRNSIFNLIYKEFDGSEFTVGNVLARDTSYTRYFISYKSDGLTISGIMNVPVGEGPFPVLILNHGYIDPAVYTNGRGLKREQDYFARNGYIVIHPDYRGHAQSDPDPEASDERGLAYSGYTTDVVNAIVALKKSQLSFVNIEKVGMLGHSMGGGVTMNALIARPELIDAAVLFAPVSSDYQKNFLRWRKDDISPADHSAIESEIGIVNDMNNFRAFSSATYFDNIDDPILIHHGTGDTDVPVAWSYETRDALQSAGKAVTFFAYPGEPHEFAVAWPLVMRRSLDFFNENLR